MTANTDMQPTILLLGTGHWSNPGKDYQNYEFDDMLAPRRQREIEAVLDRLVTFAPTKVALELMPDHADTWNADYRRYREGQLALTANERHQLGFRLSALVDHERVYGVDWHDLERPIGWDQAIAFAEAHAQHDRISFFTQSGRASGEHERLRRMTVREQLLEANEPTAMAAGHHVYMDLAQVGMGSHYVGADVVLRWYERNLKIFVNLSRIAMSPDDRVLVIIGAGHLLLLAHFLAGAGRFTLEDAHTYLA